MQIAFAARTRYTLQLNVRANFSRGLGGKFTGALKFGYRFSPYTESRAWNSISNYTLSRTATGSKVADSPDSLVNLRTLTRSLPACQQYRVNCSISRCIGFVRNRISLFIWSKYIALTYPWVLFTYQRIFYIYRLSIFIVEQVVKKYREISKGF